MSELWQFLHAHVLGWLLLLWATYVLGLAGWIVLQKREPIATVSWLLSLALLPGLGLVIYHFLGPQRIRRQRIKRVRSHAQLDRKYDADVHSHPCSSLMRLGYASGRYLPSHCDRVQLLDGNTTFDAIVAAVTQAQIHVHLEYYIFEPDQTGTQLRDALIERARHGVKVRLLIDALGSWHLSETFLAPLREAGAEIAFFHRFLLRRIWRPNMNLRSHRKIIVIDAAIGFTGGANIADSENAQVSGASYHDLHIRVEGDVVQWLQQAFVEDWAYSTTQILKDKDLWPAPNPRRGPICAQVLPAGPDSPWETIHRVKLAAIYQARQRIWLATPYFVPGDAARMALTSAALRGLDVRVLVPNKTDSRLVTAAARSYFDELMHAGVRVFQYPGMLHSKALLIDENVCILGSSNFDNRSFRLNFELCVLFENSGVASALQTVLTNDLTTATEVICPRRLPLGQQLAEAGARLLSPLL